MKYNERKNTRALRGAAVVLALILTMLTLTGCGKNAMEQLAETAWKQVTPIGRPDGVYVMKYTRIDHLTDKDITDNLRPHVPSNGICIVFTSPAGVYTGQGMHFFFMGEDGYVRYHFDYSDYYALYENTNPASYSIRNVDQLEKATAYLADCNWMRSIELSTLDGYEYGVPAQLQDNVWYEFSDKQAGAFK